MPTIPVRTTPLPTRVTRELTSSAARRALPFLGMVVLCALLPLLPHSISPDLRWYALAWATFAVMLVAGILGNAVAELRGLHTYAPLLVFAVMHFLRASDGNYMSGFTPMMVLPILWFALYGTRGQLVLAVGGAVLAAGLPVAVLGSPQYPYSTIRGLVLLVVVFAMVGAVVQALVHTAHRRTASATANARRFRSVFDGAPVGMAVSAEPTTPQTRFVLVNRALCTALGRDQTDLMRTPLELLVHPDDLDMLIALPHSDHSSPTIVRFRPQMHRTVWVSASCMALVADTADGADGAEQWAWQLEDITAKREADNALLGAIDAERATSETLRRVDAQRRELISSVSHDLRTPVTAALGYAELLVDGGFGELTPEQLRTMTIVARGLTNLSHIITELTRIVPEFSWENTPRVEVDVAAVVRESVQMVSMDASMRAQTIDVCIDETDVYVAGDEVRLSRAIVNLLANAVKFTPEHGRIGVALTADDGTVSVAITDDGAGIAPRDQAKIFERFYRAPREHDAAGSGLGLAIVKAIATQHGGDITLVSTPGHGATFTLELPLASRIPRRALVEAADTSE